MNKRLPVTIHVQPWFKDHNFNGKTILAGVETMSLLAAGALTKYPDIDIRIMKDCLFAKFLEIRKQATTMAALVEYEEKSDSRVQAKLLSQVQIGKMRRIKEHGEIFFPKTSISHLSAYKIDHAEPPSPAKKIASEHIYRELVPFGPHYHTLQGNLYISELGAWGKLKAPQLPFTDPVQNTIGSPFPLDGAMHAACVLGQQYVDYAPFPVGFKKRVIVRPTQPGAEYTTRVMPVSQSADEQIFNLDIFNTDGEVFETVTGLRMRDVSSAIR